MLNLRPEWKTTLTVVVLLPVLLGLGFWQLDRAAQKRDILDRHVARMELPPVAPAELAAAEAEFRPLRVSGRYLGEHIILLDNRMREGRYGMEVIVPLEIPGEEQLLLVNRGWIEADRSRRSLPRVPPVAGEHELSGQAVLPDERMVRALDGHAEEWPRVAQWPDPEALSGALERPVYPFILRLDPDQPGALHTEWPLLASAPERHTGYAVQWFALALVLVLLWLWASRRPNPTGETPR